LAQNASHIGAGGEIGGIAVRDALLILTVVSDALKRCVFRDRVTAIPCQKTEFVDIALVR
jgi:hypothetical protein